MILDTEINSELVAEGLANDVLRFIQDTRKAAGFDVSDRINLTYSADPALSMAIEQHRRRIMRDALIREMNSGIADDYTTDVEGYNLAISVEKVK